MKNHSLVQVFALNSGGSVDWVKKAAAAHVGSQRAKSLLLVIAVLADRDGVVHADIQLLAATAELSVMECCVFISVLKNREFLRWDVQINHWVLNL